MQKTEKEQKSNTPELKRREIKPGSQYAPGVICVSGDLKGEAPYEGGNRRGGYAKCQECCLMGTKSCEKALCMNYERSDGATVHFERKENKSE